jgi:pimeloyl-ACP methyl ester carboxylesterase
MLVDLVRLTTRDGLRLDGALRSPAADVVNATPFDAALLLHGVQSNFYTSSTFEGLAQPLLDLGLNLLQVNTRGHDNVYAGSTALGGRRWLGAAYEVIDECRHDVAAWCDWLTKRGMRRIVLIGHSLGAVKAVYSQAREPQASVQAVVAISPPRLSHRAYLQAEDNVAYLESLAVANRLIAADKPNELFQSKYPFPLLIAAAAFLDKYGPGERYNIVERLPQLQTPILFVYGGRELEQGGISFRGVPKAIEAARPGNLRCEVQVVENADHLYTGATAPLSAAVCEWIRRLS